MPLSQSFETLDLMDETGSDTGYSLHSKDSARNITNHIAAEMRKRFCKQIKDIEGKISILIDESTTLADKTTLIVYLKAENNKSLDPEFLFFDLIELPNQRAETIMDHLLKCLSDNGFDDGYLKKHLVAFASDGASVMLGRKAGIATKMSEKYPNILTWHCLNHRLELAVGDTVHDITAMNHFQSFMDSLYTLYSRSPQNQEQLKECAAKLTLQVRRIGRVLDTRWVTSSYRTVSAVWDSYDALCAHFSMAMSDVTRPPLDRNKYSMLVF